MTLTNLKVVCAAMLEKDVADLTVGGVDLFLHAANSARRSGERRHNFERCRISGSLVIAGASGGAFSALSGVQGEATGGLREVVALSQVNAGGHRIPLRFTRYDVAIGDEMEEIDALPNGWPNLRYPSDAEHSNLAFPTQIVQRGNKLYFYPYAPGSTEEITLQVEGYGWLPNYTAGNLATEDLDFFVSHGYDYLQWAVLLELNARFKQFVYRQEGNLADKFLRDQRDEAFLSLTTNDSYSLDSNLTF